MRNYMLIGQIKGAKAVSRKDKATGTTLNNCEVIVMFEDYDKNGELVMDTDTIQFDISELDKFKSNVNKFIAVPYLLLNTKSGTYLFPDEMMTFHFYNTNPLFPNSNNTSETKKAS